jgi:hypothetical protein
MKKEEALDRSSLSLLDLDKSMPLPRRLAKRVVKGM